LGVISTARRMFCMKDQKVETGLHDVLRSMLTNV
jgi:hypothetical protein